MSILFWKPVITFLSNGHQNELRKQSVWCHSSHICKNRVHKPWPFWKGKWEKLHPRCIFMALRWPCTSQLGRNAIGLWQALKTSQCPLPCPVTELWEFIMLWVQIYSRVVFSSTPQKVLEGAFTAIVTWPQAEATKVCSTAHPHTQSQYIHPLAHSVSPKQLVPQLALTVYSSSQDAHRASRLCIEEGFC